MHPAGDKSPRGFWVQFPSQASIELASLVRMVLG